MKKIILSILLCFNVSIFFATEITNKKIVDIGNYYCDETCGNINSYEKITIDIFRGLYNTSSKSDAKVGFTNMTIAYIEDYGVQLRNSNGEFLRVFVFDENVMKKLILSKGKYVNIYGHVYNHVRYGYGITPDVIDFLE